MGERPDPNDVDEDGKREPKFVGSKNQKKELKDTKTLRGTTERFLCWFVTISDPFHITLNHLICC